MIAATIYSPFARPRVSSCSLPAAVNIAAARDALSPAAIVVILGDDVYNVASAINHNDKALDKVELVKELQLREILKGVLVISPSAWMKVLEARWDEDSGVSKSALVCALHKLYGLDAKAIERVTELNANTIRSALRRDNSRSSKQAQVLASMYVIYALYHGYVLADELLGREYFA